jgi:sugar/nucleoside kinase (ribokinase family)
MTPRIAVAGVVNVRTACCLDTFPPAPGHWFDQHGISIRLSGTGWTITRLSQQFGASVTFATYVGMDELGQLALNGLARHDLLGPTTLRCESHPRSMVFHGRNGDKVSVTDLRTTPHLSFPGDVFASALGDREHDMAVLTNIGFTRPLIPVAESHGVPIATDLHVVDRVDSTYNRPWMAAAHIVACSHEALPMTAEAWVRAMWSRYGTEIVLVGCGAAGAVLGVRALGRIWHVPAVLPRGLTYVSGAGDALLASFVYHYLTLEDPLVAARNAVLTAGWKVGGDPDEEAGTAARLTALRSWPLPPEDSCG